MNGINVHKERVFHGMPAELVRQASGPIAGTNGCGDGKHCACHGGGPFYCCRCGATFVLEEGEGWKVCLQKDCPKYTQGEFQLCEQHVAELPTITKTEGPKVIDYERFKIVGGVVSGFTVREGREAWCEVTIWNKSSCLGSYGGEVWPGAWPLLFMHHKGSYMQAGPTIYMTPIAEALFERARKAWVPK